MTLKNLTDLVKKLIESKREDDYWDFKLEHHTKKSDLLLDILCMANNLTQENGYIIFGIKDKTFEIKGVENDSHRRTQQSIIDFLNSTEFFMDNRPKIELKEISLKGRKIDILIIYNTLSTPYYITKPYGKIKVNNIYTRIGDTNTPINESADPIHIEYLWKKRFGLHLSSLNRFRYLLKEKSNWEKHEDYWKEYEYYFYNTIHPEYTIRFSEDPIADALEFYSYRMTNKSTSYQYLEVKHYSTTIYSRQLAILDGGRFKTLVPEWKFLETKYLHYSDSFKYYITDSIDYEINNFLYDNQNHDQKLAKYSFDEVILYFKSEEEKDFFVEYYANNLNEFKKIYSEYKNKNHVFDDKIYNKEKINREINFALSLKKLQEKWNYKIETGNY